MIIEATLTFLQGILDWFVGLIPSDWTPPEWFSGAASAVAGFFDSATTMGVWIPLDFAFACALALINAYIGGGVVKMIRILISHFTGGGGSAA